MQFIGATIAMLMLIVVCSALLTAPVTAGVILLRRRLSPLVARVVMSTAQTAAAALVLYVTKYSQLLEFSKPSLAEIAGDSALVAACGGIGWAIASALVPPAMSPSEAQSRNRRVAMAFLTIYIAFVSVVVLALLIFLALSYTARQQAGLAAVSFGISEALVELFIIILLIAGVWWLRTVIVRHQRAPKL
jgi:uncharacterized membrane protein YozB (DUF420 family)